MSLSNFWNRQNLTLGDHEGVIWMKIQLSSKTVAPRPNEPIDKNVNNSNSWASCYVGLCICFCTLFIAHSHIYHEGFWPCVDYVIIMQMFPFCRMRTSWSHWIYQLLNTIMWLKQVCIQHTSLCKWINLMFKLSLVITCFFVTWF
jgi:hypothetical protein